MADDMSFTPPVPTDPRLPLNAMQVFKLKKSWKGIKRCLDDTGIETFIRLFRMRPCMQALFKNLKGKTLEQLRVDEELEKQAGKMMGVLDECVQNIDNVDSTQEILSRTAALHTNLPGFCASMFLEVAHLPVSRGEMSFGQKVAGHFSRP
ncbi:hypothetical protein ACOMHN_022033 [Nucella lapillus]